MRLLAVYIKEYRELFHDVMLQFSSAHEVIYVDNQLIIKKNEKYRGFYGEVFQDITAIVGKNGTGKTAILELIGNPEKDRAEKVYVENGQVKDCYFLLYETGEEGIYYIEIVGDFYFINIYGKQRGNKKGFSYQRYYFTYTNDIGEVTQYREELRDKIIYLTDEKQEDRLDINMFIKQEQRFIPRVRRHVLSLQEWYRTYFTLTSQEILESDYAKVIIRCGKANHILRKNETYILLREQVKEATEHIGDNLLVTTEIFNDLLSHHIMMMTNQIIGALDSEIGKNRRYHEFVETYDDKITIWTIDKLNQYFDDLKDIFSNDGWKEKNNIKLYDYIELLELYQRFYQKLFQIKEYTIAGLDEFTIRLNGNHIDTKIIEFAQSYDGLHKWFESHERKHKSHGDILYEEEELYRTEEIDIDELYTDIVPLLSDGEKKIISLIASIAEEVREYINIQPLCEIRRHKCFLVLIDEIEKEMHLEWSRNMLNNLVAYFDKYKYRIGGNKNSKTLKELNVNIQLIFSTHSPFMLSDLHSRSVIRLERKKKGIYAIESEKVFAQNIQKIMKEDFFMEAGVGEFSKKTVNEIIQWLNSENGFDESKSERCKSIIEEIREPILRKKLEKMYQKKMKDEKEN